MAPTPKPLARAPVMGVRSLADLLEAREVGGKAFNLSRIIALGEPVPAGVVVTNEIFQRFLDENNLRTRINALCRGLDVRFPGRLREASRAIGDLVNAAPLPGLIRHRLREWWDARPPGTLVVVRSSATGEDSQEASFAGQLESRLNIRRFEGLEAALLACWASYWSERALFYQIAKGIDLGGMGVIVQEQVPAAIAGVLFTQSPGAPDSMVGEYCGGLGDALVSGGINPGRFTIARQSGAWKKELSPEQPLEGGDGSLFNNVTVAALEGLGKKLECAFGAPQDIEWALDGKGRLWCLQSRPITTGPAAPAVPPPLVLWSNANVSENFPAPISPLLYSIASSGYYHYFRNLARSFGLSPRRVRAMEQPLRNIIGVHGARMYYNLTSIHGILRAAPFGDLLTGWFNEFAGISDRAPSPAQPELWSRTRMSRAAQAGEAAIIALKTTWQYLFLRRRLERFERTVTEFSRRTEPRDLASRPLEELLDDLRHFVDIRCNRWTEASLADAGSMVCYGALKALLERAFPGADRQAALHNTLLKALPDVVSGIPVLRLWDLSRRIREDAALAMLFASQDGVRILDQLRSNAAFTSFVEQLEVFLDEWGFRSSSELMLTVPSFQENPAPLLDILKKYASLDGESPLDIMRAQDAGRSAETGRVMAALKLNPLAAWMPFLKRSHLIGIVLRWTQRCVVYRERARLKQALLYSRCRRIALAIGARLAAQGRLRTVDDIFFLTYQEIDALGSGAAMFPNGLRSMIEWRRAQHAALSAMRPPDSFALPEGEYLPLHSEDEAAAPTYPVAGGCATLAGTAACGGQVTGRAAVLSGVEESHLIGKDDVLVTKQTDPGWAPVFFLIKGLVIERGGMLSHGAIVAREFGLPCVVGAAGATRRIAPGQVVTIDGDKGEVRLGASPSEAA